MQKSTVGWNLLIYCKDGSKEWIPLLVRKVSDTIEVAEFATAHGISNELVFTWWVPYILWKRDNIISSVNAQVKRTTHKYDVAIIISVEETYAIDTKNGNIL